MSTGSAMAAKTAKARKLDMLEMRYIQSRGDCADYQRGRVMLPYGYQCRRGEEQTKWVYAHALTPMEQWAVRKGYISNPFPLPQGPKHTGRYFPVYYADGHRRMCKTLEDARTHLNDKGAVRLFDGARYEYAV